MHEHEPVTQEALGADVPRRKVLGWAVGIINLGVFAAVIGPVLGFVTGPLRAKRREGQWIAVLPETDLADGQTKAVTYGVQVLDGYMTANRNYSAYLFRKGSKVVAYDPSCPHLGCRVEFKERKKRYICPCHGGVFDEEGNVLSGPPPKGLSTLGTKIEGGKIWVYRV